MTVHLRHRRMVIAMASSASLTLGLAGCGSASATKAPTTQTSNHITITWLSHDSSATESLKEHEAKEFEALHPNVTVKLITPESGLVFAKYETLVGGGQAPDVYEMSFTYGAQLLSDGALDPVNYGAMGVSNYSQLARQYIPGILSAYEYHGELYGIPQEYSNYQMWINANDFRQAHLPLPTTWNQVIQDASKLKVVNNGVVQRDEISLPINFPEAEYLVIDAMARELGKPLINTAGTRSYLTSPAVVKTFTTLQDLVKSGAFVPSLNGTTLGFERDLYGENRAAILLDAGSWYTAFLKTSYPAVWKESLVDPYPTYPGHSSQNDTYGYAFVVSKSVAHPTWAWKFIHFLQQQGKSYFNLGWYTGLKSLNSLPSAKTQPFWESKWVPSLAQGHYATSLTNGSKIDDIIGTAYDNIILRNANVKQTLATAQQEIQPLLNH